jgi:hypothetical protein
MAYPGTYERVVGVSGFTTHSTNFPTTPHTGANLDSEFNTLRSRTTEMLVFLAGITRSDGALANGIVTQDSLSEDIYAGINPPAPWVTATAYTLRDSVTINGILYRCIVAHTSGVFATDLAAAKWTEVIDFSELIGDIALSDSTPITISAGAGSAGTSDFAARADHSHPYTDPLTDESLLAQWGKITATLSSGTTAMTARRRYRISSTATGTLPTMVQGDFVIVEFTVGAGVTGTVGRNSQTIDGASADDTYTGDGGDSGPVIRYRYSSAGAVTSELIGGVPI